MVSNKLIIISILVLFLVIFATLFNIHVFMHSESKCSSGFEVIKKCGCIPDSNFAELLNVKGVYDFNISNFQNGSK